MSCQRAGDELLLLRFPTAGAVAAAPKNHSAPLEVFFLHSDEVECKLGKKMGEQVDAHVVYLGRRDAIWKLKLYQNDSLEILL